MLVFVAQPRKAALTPSFLLPKDIDRRDRNVKVCLCVNIDTTLLAYCYCIVLLSYSTGIVFDILSVILESAAVSLYQTINCS